MKVSTVVHRHPHHIINLKSHRLHCSPSDKKNLDLVRIGCLPTALTTTQSPQQNWSPRSLAFLGDSIWELYVRRAQFYTVTHLRTMHEATAKTVQAETQAKFYEDLYDGEFLKVKEREVLRWGLNTKSPPGSKSTSVEAYRKSTALECLLGYLYLSDDIDRLHSLMSHLGLCQNENK